MKERTDEGFETNEVFSLKRPADGSQPTEKQAHHAWFSFRRHSNLAIPFLPLPFQDTEDVGERDGDQQGLDPFRVGDPGAFQVERVALPVLMHRLDSEPLPIGTVSGRRIPAGGGDHQRLIVLVSPGQQNIHVKRAVSCHHLMEEEVTGAFLHRVD